MSRVATLLFTALVALGGPLLGGCTWLGNGSGTFESTSLTLERCDGEDPKTFAPFRLHANFFTLNVYENEAEIRIQDGGRDPGFSNFILLHIRDWQYVSENFTAALPIDGQLIRGSLYLFESCPDSFQATSLQGTISFTKIGSSKNARVEGTLVVDVIDSRNTATIVAAGLSGDFKFRIAKGPPYETFTLWPGTSN
ncbi:MAG: hypothetical protein KC609_12560 [Myxococcales bacterium]|nr:hypothetical protein [Myxococcales bacterium]